MNDESTRLKSKLQRLEYVLEKQRWSQKEQVIKFEKTVDKIEQELEEMKFTAQYNKEQVNRYQLVLSNLVEGVYAMDADGNVLAMNNQAQSMINEDEITPILLQAASITAGPDNHHQETIEQGNLKLEISARPLLDKENKVVGSVATIREVH